MWISRFWTAFVQKLDSAELSFPKIHSPLIGAWLDRHLMAGECLSRRFELSIPGI
jgi:hypothetical protein